MQLLIVRYSSQSVLSTNNRIQIPSLPVNKNGYSISFNIYFDDTSKQGMIFSFNSTSNRMFMFANFNLLQVGSGTSAITFYTVQTNTWYKILWTLSIDGTTNIYVNGVNVFSTKSLIYLTDQFTSNGLLSDPWNNWSGNSPVCYIEDFQYSDIASN